MSAIQTKQKQERVKLLNAVGSKNALFSFSVQRNDDIAAGSHLIAAELR